MTRSNLELAIQAVTATPRVPMVRTAYEWRWAARQMALRTTTTEGAVRHFARCRSGAAQVWHRANGSAKVYWTDGAGVLRSRVFTERELLRLSRMAAEDLS